jgi:UDP-N-acetylmuramate--alanine ligase
VHVTHFHIVGIGGAGMSAIARILLARGHEVSGSDNGRWPLSEALARDGVAVHDRFDAEYVTGAEIVIRSSAYKPDNVEVRAAVDAGQTVWKRHEAWRFLTKDQRVVAIAGTHGKSTTTAMTWSAIKAGGVDASLICGATVRDLESNAYAGSADVFVIEADEYDNTFLALRPDVAVVTTLDHDHVDVFPTRESYRDAFRAFVRGARQGGAVIAAADDPGARELAEWAAGRKTHRVITFGTSESADIRVWQTEDAANTFAIAERAHQRTVRVTFKLGVRGWHNVMNATAAMLAAEAIGVPRTEGRRGVEAFRGIERRLETLGVIDGIEVVDDYAHHPAEIRAGRAAFLDRAGDTIVVFQPHTPSRLAAFFDEFVDALKYGPAIIVETFRSAREEADPHDRARTLAEAVGGRYAADGETAARLARELAKPGDVILVMGAGDVRPVGWRVLELLRTPV